MFVPRPRTSIGFRCVVVNSIFRNLSFEGGIIVMDGYIVTQNYSNS